MKRKSLLSQLSWAILLVTVVILSLFEAQRYLQLRQELNHDLEQVLQQTLARLQASTLVPVYNLDTRVVRSILRSEMSPDEISAISISENGGELLLGFIKDENGLVVASELVSVVSPSLTATADLKMYGEVFGEIRVSVDGRIARKKLNDKLIDLIVEVMVLGLFLVGMVVYVLRRFFVQPVLQLSAISREIANNNLVVEIDLKSENELGALAFNLSLMRDSIRSTIETLADERENLRIILDSIGDGVIAVDQAMKIDRFNPVAEELTACYLDDFRGCKLSDVFDLVDGDSGEVLTGKVGKALLQGKKFSFPYKTVIRLPLGKSFPVAVSASPICNRLGKIIGMVLVIRDVSEQRKFEEMVIQAEKMVSVGGLAAGMAHEINNPLGIVLQAAQNIRRRIAPEIEANRKCATECGVTLDEIRAYLEKRKITAFVEDIQSAGSRAAHIVRNMLQFSRRSELQAESTDISKLIERAVELAANDYDLKKKFDFRQIEIIREYDLNLPEIEVIKTELEQVILNLLKNAAQAIFTTSMEKSEPCLILRVMREADFVRIEIEDNGPGMEENIRKRIFEPFYTTKPVGEGTGLGLSVSYMIITHNHNGEMWVHSPPGGGTTFIIRLPV
ncbi:MAG: ATP-binding protein [Pseudomonadota bacterium]|nr:ATP-binding protein [Pseudomonadota bacterium]